MPAEDLSEALHRLGALRRDSIQTYVACLSGQVRAQDIDAAVGIEAGRLVRRELTQFGLVLERRTPDGLTLFALPPTHAWTAREADFTWAAARSLAPIDELPDTGSPTVDEARKLCREIRRLAAERFAVNDDLLLARQTALRTAAAAAAGLSQLIYAARESVRGMSRRPHLPNLSTVWEAINFRLAQPNFSYTRLVEAGTLVEDGLAIVRRDVVQTGVTLRVASPRTVQSTFYIADERAVFQQRSLGDAGIYTDKRRINGSAARFESAVGASRPGLNIASALQFQAEGLLGRARQAGLHGDDLWWLCHRINYGRFADAPPSWSGDTLHKVENRLAAAGCIVASGDLAGFPNYVLEFEVLVAAEQQQDASRGPAWCPDCWCSMSMCECD